MTILDIAITKLGTDYGGWYVPLNMKLDAHSVIYSGGIGEDILIQCKYSIYF